MTDKVRKPKTEREERYEDRRERSIDREQRNVDRDERAEAMTQLALAMETQAKNTSILAEQATKLTIEFEGVKTTQRRLIVACTIAVIMFFSLLVPVVYNSFINKKLLFIVEEVINPDSNRGKALAEVRANESDEIKCFDLYVERLNNAALPALSARCEVFVAKALERLNSPTTTLG